MRPVLVLLAWLLAGPALAHPHVWVTAASELVYGPDGKVAGIRHHWTFDEAYSAFAVQGLDANKDGTTSPEELDGFARTSMESLVDHGYFTTLRAGGAKQGFGEPREARMTHRDGRVTLHFELPLRSPAANRLVVLEVSDPTFFVEFRSAPGDEAVTLAGAPAGCTVQVTRPKAPPAAGGLSETFFQSLTAASTYGGQFASRAMAACP